MAIIGNPNPSPERRSRILSRARVLKQPGGGPAQQAPNGSPARQAQQPQRTQKGAPAQQAQTTRQAQRGAATQQQPPAEPTPREQYQQQVGQEGGKRSFTAAFTALKQTRLFRNLKRGAANAGQVRGKGLMGLFEDNLEADLDHERARSYLAGKDVDYSEYGQARREARLLQHLERLGNHPIHLIRYLLSLLGMNRERDFKHFIVDQLKSRLDVLAGRMGEFTPPQRRLMAALVARASYQVGIRSAENFSPLLAAAGTAEAAHWAKLSETPEARAQQLAQILKRAASPVYRTALISAGREALKKLASDTVGLPPDELQLTWISLLRAADCLESNGQGQMADALVAGIFSKGGPSLVGSLGLVLERAMAVAPGGAALVVQLIVTLTARGEVKVARQLVELLRAMFQQARGQCFPVFNALRDMDAQRAPEESKDNLYRQLEARGQQLAGLLPACSRVLEKGQGIPEGSTALITEALLCLATLSCMGGTTSGQRMLHRALLAQERGRETFLTTLPRVALTLAQPTLVQPLWEAGLTTTYYKYGGRPFLERVALHTGRAVVNPLIARSRKGDVATAKALLRSMIRNNAALFCLSADGAHLAWEAIEAQRDKPGLVPLKKTQYRLAKIRKKNSTGQHPDSIEPFQDLITALAAGGVRKSDPRAGTGARMTLLELSANVTGQRKSNRTATHLELHVDQLERGSGNK
ncbi:MAG TPA: hypothetical protein VK539_25675 [Myxococcaceae bacterium]|nr:hypothetical protein [Myxococcaceae bacterium]